MKILLKVIKVIGWISLIVWILLTVLVLIFLFYIWQNPHMKSISNLDLLRYRNFTAIFLLIFAATRLTKIYKTTL